jgi:hypothetical protein
MIFSRNQKNHDDLLQTIRNLPVNRNGALECFSRYDYDDVRRDLVKESWDMVIVAEPGAYGMEVCIGTRKTSHEVALVWFTDDAAFAAQSYRLNCTYFSQLPVSQRNVENAFARMAEQQAMRRWQV